MMKKIFSLFRKLPKAIQIIVALIVIAFLANITDEVIKGCIEKRKRALENGDLGGEALYKGDATEDEYYEDYGYDDDNAYDSGYEDPNTGISYYYVGDTIYLKQGGGEFTLVITDWGSGIGALGTMGIYAQYEIENTGKTDIKAGNNLFSVYADDYAIDQVYLDDGVHGETMTLSTVAPGRMLRGTVYAEMNPDDYSTIDLIVGDVDVRLKDE